MVNFIADVEAVKLKQSIDPVLLVCIGLMVPIVMAITFVILFCRYTHKRKMETLLKQEKRLLGNSGGSEERQAQQLSDNSLVVWCKTVYLVFFKQNKQET